MLLRLGLRFVAGALLCGLPSSHARDFDKEVQAKIKRLVDKNGKGADRELKQRLIRMAKQDQAIRAELRVQTADPRDNVQHLVAPRATVEMVALGTPRHDLPPGELHLFN